MIMLSLKTAMKVRVWSYGRCVPTELFDIHVMISVHGFQTPAAPRQLKTTTGNGIT